MTRKPMPWHVKGNFLYSKIWSDIYYKQRNANLLVTGEVGFGKSLAAMRILSDLDPQFNPQRVIFSVKALLDLVNDGDDFGKLKRGSAILFDEIAGSEQAADARSFMSKENKRMGYFTTTARSKGYITCFCAPTVNQIDLNVRRVGVTGMVILKEVDTENQQGIANFFWKSTDAMTDKSYYPRPRVKDLGRWKKVSGIRIMRPDRELERGYETQKDLFQKGNFKRWRMQLEVAKKKQKLGLPELYAIAKKNIYDLVEKTKDGFEVSTSSLCFGLGIDRLTAQLIKSKIQKDLLPKLQIR